MLGHEDVRPEGEVPSLPRLLDRLSKPQARSLGLEETIAMVAGEGQLVRVPEFIEAASTLNASAVVHAGEDPVLPDAVTTGGRRWETAPPLGRGFEDETPA